jgi:hypothetical protein
LDESQSTIIADRARAAMVDVSGKKHITEGLSLSLNNDSKIQAALVLCFD